MPDWHSWSQPPTSHAWVQEAPRHEQAVLPQVASSPEEEAVEAELEQPRNRPRAVRSTTSLINAPRRNARSTAVRRDFFIAPRRRPATRGRTLPTMATNCHAEDGRGIVRSRARRVW